jgi:hypothetical protein
MSTFTPCLRSAHEVYTYVVLGGGGKPDTECFIRLLIDQSGAQTQEEQSARTRPTWRESLSASL